MNTQDSNLWRRTAWRVALAASLVIGQVARADDERAPRVTPDPATQALYREECGSCHVPYPARGLPARSWRELMATLDRHFGADASIDAPTQSRLTAWLVANAGSADAAGKPVLRVTETQWFRHEHDEIAAAVFRRPAVKGPSNCGACHRGAADGRYGEHDVRIPR